jgi:hypothetical protein
MAKHHELWAMWQKHIEVLAPLLQHGQPIRPTGLCHEDPKRNTAAFGTRRRVRGHAQFINAISQC